VYSHISDARHAKGRQNHLTALHPTPIALPDTFLYRRRVHLEYPKQHHASPGTVSREKEEEEEGGGSSGQNKVPTPCVSKHPGRIVRITSPPSFTIPEDPPSQNGITPSQFKVLRIAQSRDDLLSRTAVRSPRSCASTSYLGQLMLRVSHPAFSRHIGSWDFPGAVKLHTDVFFLFFFFGFGGWILAELLFLLLSPSFPQVKQQDTEDYG
jgi:hypothetical protein